MTRGPSDLCESSHVQAAASTSTTKSAFAGIALAIMMRPVQVGRLIPIQERQLSGYADADCVVTGGAAWIACRRSCPLGHPGSVHRPDLQYIRPRPPGDPGCVPQHPSQAGERRSEVGRQPVLAAVGAVLDLADPAGTGERHPHETDRFPGLREVAVLRYVKSRCGFDQRDPVPALTLPVAAIVLTRQFDRVKPLRPFHSVMPWHQDAGWASMTGRQPCAVQRIRDQDLRLARYEAQGQALRVAISRLETGVRRV